MAKVTRLILDAGGERDRPILEPPPQPREAAPADLPVETVGQALTKARQRKGEKLSDVWLVLKIRPDQLVAIEEGRWDALPGRVYTIGYVRSYAAYLGLEPHRLLERLKVELDGPTVQYDPGATTVSPLDVPPAVTERAQRLHVPQLRVPQVRLPQSGTVITGLLLVAFLYSGYYAFASMSRVVEPRVMAVPERLLAEARLAQKTAVDLPRNPVALPPAPVERRAPLEQSASVTVQQLPPVAPPPEPALPIPTEVAITPPAPAPTIVLPPEPAPKVIQAKLPNGKRYGTRNKNSRITLRVHRPTYIAVQGARNRKFLDRALFPGDTYRVPNMVGLRLSSPDAGAVEVILDGASMGFAGRDGANARNLSLNPQNLVDRQRG
jgi:cytoskeleton protein RodZ